MGCITRTLGRLLFVTILVSSAYLHLSKPQNFVQDLSNNYTQLNECVSKHLPGYLPPADVINWQLWSKVLGLFEGVIAILIVFGDCWGGFFLFLNLVVSGVFDYKNICSFIQWDVSRQLEFARYLFFIGASIALMSCSKSGSCTRPCGKQAKVCDKKQEKAPVK